MKSKLLFTGIILLLLISTSAFSQDLKSGEWHVEIDKWEFQEMTLMGKTQRIYTGILKVKKYNKKFGIYRFYLPEKDSVINHMTIRDLNNLVLEPRLYYQAEDKSFSCYKGTDKEMKEVTVRNDNTKFIVLSGMIIWLKQQK